MTATAPARLRPGSLRPRFNPGVALLAAVSYLPLLLTKPGLVGADTKTYLYLDPARLLSRAPYMWDTNIGLGTVTHQNIGYLWPMGPFYWLFDTLGFPDWVAQRLWLGSIIFLAGLGVRWMLRELRWDGGGLTVAAFAYALSPYLLDYSARISVILLPFVGLPWLIGLAARSLRRRDWQTPAIFALVTLTVGGVNATSLMLVMVGPLLWFLYATFVEREVDLRTAVAAGLRITLLTAITSLWWLAGLMLQGSYGIPILRYTETYETVANAALAPELMRGLGYWFFYGEDSLGPWTESTVPMIEWVPVLLISYLLPGLAVVAGLLTRWRHRVFFAAMIVAGLIIGVGAHPWESPSPYGALFKAASRTDLGLSFRSTPRAVPLIALGLAVFLGAGVAALARWRPRWYLPTAIALIVLICVNQMALFRGQMVDRYLQRDEDVPSYWLEAAGALQDGDHSTRALEVPGIDFASYRWGNTVDPITPGLTDRPFAARELIPYGTPASANLMNEIDQPAQAGRVQPNAITPLAQMLGVGDIVLRGDLQFERYLTPRPRQSFYELSAAEGLAAPVGFGEATANLPTDALLLDDEHSYVRAPADPDPWPVTIFGVEDPRAMDRAVQASAPVVLAGDAAGMVSLANIGALQVDRPLFYSASFAEDADGLDALIDEPDASLVVTDTNRRQARRWGSVRENDGFTERPGEEPVQVDNTDNRLEIFPDQTEDDQSVTWATGPLVRGSSYGNAVTYTPGDRPANAMDGSEDTAWRVAAFSQAEGEFLDVQLEAPVTADRMTLRQIPGLRDRWITAVDVSFDDGEPVRFELGDASRQPGGQELTFDERTFESLRVTIAATDVGLLRTYRGIGPVGISELTIPGVEPVREVIRPPVSLLQNAGEASIDRELTYVFSRRAANPADVNVADEEPTIRRSVVNPVAREYTPFGVARLAASLFDADIDTILGLPDADSGGVTATSNRRMAGRLTSRASLAVDGDPDTAFASGFNPGATSLSFTYSEPVTVDGLDLVVRADGAYSVPTVIDVSVDGGAAQRIALPEVDLGTDAERGRTVELRAETGTLVGTTFDITIVEMDEAMTRDWFGGRPVMLPVGIAEVGLPVVAGPDRSAALPDRCHDDLVMVGDASVPMRLVGTVGQAEALEGLQLQACGESVAMPEGDTEISTARGAAGTVDVDVLAFASAAGGTGGTDTLTDPPGPGPTPPETTPRTTSRLTHELEVRGATEPYWVVLGQSLSAGWRAETADGVDLGEPTLINGYANGWLVDPTEVGADATIVMRWTPQKVVWVGLAASALGVVICAALILVNPRRRRREDPDDSSDPDAPDESPDGQAMVPVMQMPGAADPPVSTASAVVATAVAAVLATFFGGVFVGVALAVATPIALLSKRGQFVVRGAAAVLLAAAFCFVVAKQAGYGYEVTFEWVLYFETVHVPTIAAVFLMLLSVVADLLRGGDEPPPPEVG